MKKWEMLLKSALQSKAACKFINSRNDSEPRLKTNNKLRPVILWTQRVAFTAAQRSTLERMCGFAGNKGFGWSILSPVWSFEEQCYAVVCENVNGMHTTVYPNGEMDPPTKAVLFRPIGEWTLTKHVNRPVPKVASTEKLGFVPLEEREPDTFESAPVRISGLYHRGFFRVDN